MKLTVSLIVAFVGVFSSSSSFAKSFFRRRDCQQAIESVETFKFRELNQRPPTEVALGPDREIAGVSYRSVTVDGEPVLFFARGSEGTTVRWGGRASVAKLRTFVERALDGQPPTWVISKYSNESAGYDTEAAGVPSLGRLYFDNALVEARTLPKAGGKRNRSFLLKFDQPGAGLPTEVAGSVLSRREPISVGVKFAPQLLANENFRGAIRELIDETSAAWQLWPDIDRALDVIAEQI